MELGAGGGSVASSLAAKISGNAEAGGSSNGGGLHQTTVGESTSLGGNVAEHVVHKGVENGHTLGGDANLTLGTDQLEDVASEGPVHATSLAGAALLGLATGLGSLLALTSHDEKRVGGRG